MPEGTERSASPAWLRAYLAPAGGQFRRLRRSAAGRTLWFLVAGVRLVHEQVLRGFHLLLLGDVAAGEEDGLLGGDVAAVPEEGAVREVFAAERELDYRRAGDGEARVGELE